jgi:hypothetical protein
MLTDSPSSGRLGAAAFLDFLAIVASRVWINAGFYVWIDPRLNGLYYKVNYDESFWDVLSYVGLDVGLLG